MQHTKIGKFLIKIKSFRSSARARQGRLRHFRQQFKSADSESQEHCNDDKKINVKPLQCVILK